MSLAQASDWLEASLVKFRTPLICITTGGVHLSVEEKTMEDLRTFDSKTFWSRTHRKDITSPGTGPAADVIRQFASDNVAAMNGGLS